MSISRSGGHNENIVKLQATIDSQNQEIEAYKKRLHKMVRKRFVKYAT